MRHSVPETQPPASTIPSPKRRPPTRTLAPRGHTWIFGASSPVVGSGTIRDIRAAKAVVATSMPSSTARMSSPLPLTKRSRKEAAKQSLARWMANPIPRPMAHQNPRTGAHRAETIRMARARARGTTLAPKGSIWEETVETDTNDFLYSKSVGFTDNIRFGTWLSRGRIAPSKMLPEGESSRQLACYPPGPYPLDEGGLPREPPREMGIPESDPCPLPPGPPQREGPDPGRVLPGDGLPSEVGPAPAQRPAPGTAATTAAAPGPNLRDPGDPGAGRHLAGGWLPLVGAPAGPAPPLVAVGADPLPAHPRAGAAAARAQPSADGPPPRPAPAAGQEGALRPDQARDALEAPHPAPDRSVGCNRAGLHRDRPGRPRRRVRGGGVPPLPEPDGHPHHLGGDPGRPGPRPDRGAAGVGGDAAGPPLRLAGHRLGSRLGVHQRPPVPVLPGGRDPVHPGAALQEGRQCPCGAEELDPRPEAHGLRALRLPRGLRGDERPVPGGAPAPPEPLPALGEARAQGPGGLPPPAGLRSAPDPLRAGARLPRGRSGEGGPAPGAPGAARSLRPRPGDRREAHASVRPRPPPREAGGQTDSPASHRGGATGRPGTVGALGDPRVRPHQGRPLQGKGNISNGATIRSKVTFLDGLTGGTSDGSRGIERRFRGGFSVARG